MDCKYVLAVSGGGVKDLIPSIILDLIQSELKIDQSFFDLIVATSGGSMLTCYGSKMIKSQKNFQYKDLFNETNLNQICDKTVWDRVMQEVQFSPVYDGQGKKLVLNKYFGSLQMKDLDQRIAIPVYNLYKCKTELFTTYQSECANLLISDVCDAASAAIPYFPCVKLGENMYVDGGFSSNDPLMVAFTEARKLFGSQTPIRLLAIGTGRQIPSCEWKQNPIEKWGFIQWIKNGFLDLTMSAPLNLEIDNLARLMSIESSHNRLLYLNEHVPIDIKLDDTRPESLSTLQNIGKATFFKHENDLRDFFNQSSSRSWNYFDKTYADVSC